MNKRNNIKLAVGGSTIFKLFLLVGIVLISIVFIWYTLYVIGQLKAEAERTATSYVKLWQLAASENSTGGEVQIIFEEVIKKANFPVIIASLDGEPIFWRNVDGIIDNDPSEVARMKIKELAAEMKEANGEIPLSFGGRTISYFYYGDSRVIRRLRFMPFVELGLVGAFILVGFVGFQNIKRSEERKIWVGMAKETAHQLGTPISSLLGWLEILHADSGKADFSEEKGSHRKSDIFMQMEADVTRLQRVANRFGQIGSKPELKKTNIVDLIDETIVYYRKRLPFNGKGIELVFRESDVPPIYINGELFTWAVENLLKNSLQAVDSQNGKIEISTNVSKNGQFVIIEIRDNGKGIPAGMARKLFRPGFTTKKRGWGLGLTLARRIVEEYHRGRIYLVSSRPGETVFNIILPVNKSGKVGRFDRHGI